MPRQERKIPSWQDAKARILAGSTVPKTVVHKGQRSSKAPTDGHLSPSVESPQQQLPAFWQKRQVDIPEAFRVRTVAGLEMVTAPTADSECSGLEEEGVPWRTGVASKRPPIAEDQDGWQLADAPNFSARKLEPQNPKAEPVKLAASPQHTTVECTAPQDFRKQALALEERDKIAEEEEFQVWDLIKSSSEDSQEEVEGEEEEEQEKEEEEDKDVDESMDKQGKIPLDAPMAPSSNAPKHVEQKQAGSVTPQTPEAKSRNRVWDLIKSSSEDSQEEVGGEEEEEEKKEEEEDKNVDESMDKQGKIPLDAAIAPSSNAPKQFEQKQAGLGSPQTPEAKSRNRVARTLTPSPRPSGARSFLQRLSELEKEASPSSDGHSSASTALSVASKRSRPAATHCDKGHDLARNWTKNPWTCDDCKAVRSDDRSWTVRYECWRCKSCRCNQCVDTAAEAVQPVGVRGGEGGPRFCSRRLWRTASEGTTPAGTSDSDRPTAAVASQQTTLVPRPKTTSKVSLPLRPPRQPGGPRIASSALESPVMQQASDGTGAYAVTIKPTQSPVAPPTAALNFPFGSQGPQPPVDSLMCQADLIQLVVQATAFAKSSSVPAAAAVSWPSCTEASSTADGQSRRPVPPNGPPPSHLWSSDKAGSSDPAAAPENPQAVLSTDMLSQAPKTPPAAPPETRSSDHPPECASQPASPPAPPPPPGTVFSQYLGLFASPTTPKITPKPPGVPAGGTAAAATGNRSPPRDAVAGVDAAAKPISPASRGPAAASAAFWKSAAPSVAAAPNVAAAPSVAEQIAALNAKIEAQKYPGAVVPPPPPPPALVIRPPPWALGGASAIHSAVTMANSSQTVAPDLSQGMYRGSIVSVGKDWCFAKCEELRDNFQGKDVYIPNHMLQHANVQVGTLVQFKLDASKNRAVEVKVVNSFNAASGEVLDPGQCLAYQHGRCENGAWCKWSHPAHNQDTARLDSVGGGNSNGASFTTPQQQAAATGNAEGTYEGVVTLFNGEKGYGFIKCDATRQNLGRDVFFDGSSSDGATFRAGLVVQFSLAANTNKAHDVKVLRIPVYHSVNKESVNAEGECGDTANEPCWWYKNGHCHYGSWCHNSHAAVHHRSPAEPERPSSAYDFKGALAETDLPWLSKQRDSRHEESEQEETKDDGVPPWRRGATSTSPAKKARRNAYNLEHIVPVKDIRYTQDSISPFFRDGRTLDQLVCALDRGEVDPIHSHFLTLRAVQISGIYFSLANRRLHCLKQYQDRVKHVVMVRLSVTAVEDPMIKDFLHRYTSGCSGGTVAVRYASGPGTGAFRKRRQSLGAFFERWSRSRNGEEDKGNHIRT